MEFSKEKFASEFRVEDYAKDETIIRLVTSKATLY
jgi:hypothetical protein